MDLGIFFVLIYERQMKQLPAVGSPRGTDYRPGKESIMGKPVTKGSNVAPGGGLTLGTGKIRISILAQSVFFEIPA